MKPEATSCFRFFDGSTSYVKVDTPIGYTKGGQYSVAFWFKTEARQTTGDKYLFANRRTDTNTAAFVIGFGTTAFSTRRKLNVYLRDDNSTVQLNNVDSNKEFVPNTWNHAVWTDNNGNCSLYINGVLDSKSFNYTTSANTYTLNNTTIGGSVTTTATGSMRGMMYDARVYNRILTAQEAQDLADGKEIDSTSLALRWIGNQNGGATVIDDSGNGNTGTFTTPFYVRDSPFYSVRSRVGGNLIYNGDFEIYPKSDNVATTTSSRWIDGTASSASAIEKHAVGWAISTSGTASAQFDTTTKYSGSASLKLSTLAAASFIEVREWPGTGGLSIYRNLVAQVQPSTTYTYNFRMKTNYVSGDATNGAYLSWIELNSAGTTLVTTSTTPVKVTQDWTEYTGTITTNAATTMMRVRPQIYGHQGTATLIMDAWFDDIVLTETTPVSRQTATGRLAVQDFGTSLRFVSATAGGDRVIVTNPSILDFVNNFTISCWSRQSVPSGTSASEVYMITKALPAGGTYKYALFGGLNNKVGFSLYNGSSNPRVDSSAATPVNKWTMWTGVYDGASIKLYMNDTLVGTTATTIALPTGTSNFEIGRRAGASDRNYNGNIDEPRVWNRALSATEVADLYQNGLTRGSTLASGLVGEWLFDEGSGSTAYDTSGNGNNGTITGATYSTDVACKNRTQA